jgi:hypothetical protein
MEANAQVLGRHGRDSGIPIPERALLDRNIPNFGLAQWNQSISHMPQTCER